MERKPFSYEAFLRQIVVKTEVPTFGYLVMPGPGMGRFFPANTIPMVRRK